MASANLVWRAAARAGRPGPAGSVVVACGGEGGGVLGAEPDDLLAAPESHRVVHDREGDVQSRAAVEDVGLVVVRERVQDVVSLPAVLDVRASAGPDDVVARAAVDDVVPGAAPDDIVAVAGVDHVAAVVGTDDVAAGTR